MNDEGTLDFKAIGNHIAAVSQQGTDDPERAEMRDVGLHFVVELAGAEGAFAPSSVETLRRVLQDDVFGGALHATQYRGRPLIETHVLLEPAAEKQPELARFVGVRIHGYSFEDLREMLFEHGGRNSHDMAYELRDHVNQALAKRDAPVAVKQIVPDHPFIITCHKAAETTNGSWPLEHMKVFEAWKLEPPAGGKKLGEGVRVGHIDTGWSKHPAMQPGVEALFDVQFNVVDNSRDARDPLRTSLFNSEPGHGTSTATLIASAKRESCELPVEDGGVTGIATRAKIVPIRVCDSTAFVCNSRVAAGLAWAVRNNCQVVSMSIGGFFVPHMEAIVNTAYEQNMILIASAGNCWPHVVHPACLGECLAIGATDENDQYWQWSPHDSRVDVAAPGVNVLTTCITVDPVDPSKISYSYDYGSGGSFATAYVAGAAALWRAYHGEDKLKSFGKLQDVFSAAVKATATKPPGWDTARHGAGVLNVFGLLEFDLTTLPKFPAQQSAKPGWLTRLLDRLWPAPVTSVTPPKPLTNPSVNGVSNLVHTLAHMTFGEPGRHDDLLSKAQEWFKVDTRRGALEKIEQFGYEMSNLLVSRLSEYRCAGRPPPGYHGPAGSDGALNHFLERGSKALRGALNK